MFVRIPGRLSDISLITLRVVHHGVYVRSNSAPTCCELGFVGVVRSHMNELWCC